MSCARSRSRNGCSPTSASSSDTSSAWRPEREVGVDPQLERLEPQLVETGGRRGDAARARDRRAVGRARARAPRRSSAAASLGRRASRLVDEATEAFEVELVRLDAEQVAGRPRDEPLAELAPQAEHVVLQRRLARRRAARRPRRRRPVAPTRRPGSRRAGAARVPRGASPHRAVVASPRRGPRVARGSGTPREPRKHRPPRRSRGEGGAGCSPSAPSATRCRGWFRRWRNS